MTYSEQPSMQSENMKNPKYVPSFNFSDQKQKQLATEFYKNCEQNLD